MVLCFCGHFTWYFHNPTNISILTEQALALDRCGSKTISAAHSTILLPIFFYAILNRKQQFDAMRYDAMQWDAWPLNICSPNYLQQLFSSSFPLYVKITEMYRQQLIPLKSMTVADSRINSWNRKNPRNG